MLIFRSLLVFFAAITVSGAIGGNCLVLAGDTPVPVFVSILPQAYFVERVGGHRVQVEVLVKPGGSPATYAPTAKQMAKLARSKVFFRIGVAFENTLMPKISQSMKGLLIVDTREGLELAEGGGHDYDEHASVNYKKHDHGELDPHIWMDPMLVKKQTAVILKTLVELDPKGRSMYEANYKAFSADLDALDTRIRETLKPVFGKIVYVYHPAYGYFCRAYGLHQKAVETGGKDPSLKHLVRFIEEARKEDVRVIFVQPQFSQKKARSIARAIDGAVVTFDPLARDYMSNLEQVAEKLATLL